MVRPSLHFTSLHFTSLHFTGDGMKFGQLILRRIVKIVATKCQILRLKCTKIDFAWGSVPDPAGGAYSTPQASGLAGFKGPTSKKRGYRKGGEREREGKAGEGKKGREGTLCVSLNFP